MAQTVALPLEDHIRAALVMCALTVTDLLADSYWSDHTKSENQLCIYLLETIYNLIFGICLLLADD